MGINRTPKRHNHHQRHLSITGPPAASRAGAPVRDPERPAPGHRPGAAAAPAARARRPRGHPAATSGPPGPGRACRPRPAAPGRGPGRRFAVPAYRLGAARQLRGLSGREGIPLPYQWLRPLIGVSPGHFPAPGKAAAPVGAAAASAARRGAGRARAPRGVFRFWAWKVSGWGAGYPSPLNLPPTPVAKTAHPVIALGSSPVRFAVWPMHPSGPPLKTHHGAALGRGGGCYAGEVG